MNIKDEIKLAHSGCVDAQERLAWMYCNGENVRKSLKKSFYWNAKAALTGCSPVSSYNLSISYFNGEGVRCNDYKAFLWAKRSARQGFPDVFFTVGIHYLYGYGVLQDASKAISFLKQAYQANNNPDAAELLSEIYYRGVHIRKSFKKAFLWMSRSAIYGKKPSALYRLSSYYFDGVGVKPNSYKSFLWAHKSAQMGSVDGMLATGWHYLNGLDVKADLDIAKYWFERITEQCPECNSAFYNLGYINYYEYHNFKIAYEYFLQAYSIDRHIASAYMLARMLVAGQGTSVNLPKAKHLLKYAAMKGHKKAQRLLNSKYWNRVSRQK